MLQNFEQHIHTKFIFGKDAEKRVGTEIAAFGVKKVLIHHDSGQFLYDSGLLDAVKGYLADAGLEVFELGGVKPNPRLSKVREGIELCRKEGIEFILAIGGGSATDSSKAIAAGTTYDGDVWDFYAHKAVGKDALMVGCLLTYPATGTEVSGGGVITNEETGEKRPYGNPDGSTRSRVSFMNPELSMTLPPYLTACGVVDMYSHIMEKYFTPDTDFGIMDRLAEAGMKNILHYGPLVLAEPQNYNYRAEIMWSGCVGADNSQGLGRAQDWAHHYIGHELSALYDTAHGATLTMICPAWMKYVYKANLPRFVRYAVEVMGVENDPSNPEWVALEGIRLTTDFFKRMGLPTTLSEGGIGDEHFDLIAKMAPISQGDDHIGSVVELRYDDVMAILEMAR
ncbi:MAG: iron-containing alcohol dehydrogenase [Clostridiales bacterium]|nr:iron-containing alcohol dehydrogenase [Clostridiales bacterium]